MADRFWSRHHESEDLVSWMHEPMIRRYINESISGSPNIWPMEWFRDWLGETRELGLSVGCGLGALERDVVSKGICRRMIGIDISDTALMKADKLATDAGLGGIEYVKGNFNQAFWDREERFDIIFFHQALHHVENLEVCVEHLAALLNPGGLLFLDEYVGPSRGDWQADLLRPAALVYQELPSAYRRLRSLKMPVDWRDPSEAIRSADILPLINSRFETVEKRDYGGNLLALMHPHLKLDEALEEEKAKFWEPLIDRERELLASGEAAYYTVYVGRLVAG